MISINFTLFAQILNFLFLVWVFNKLLIRPILKNLAVKEQVLNDRQNSVERLRDEAADREKAYRDKLKEVRRVATAKREELMARAKEEAGRLRRLASEEAAEVMNKVRIEVDNSVKESRKALKEQEEALARQLTEAVLGRSA